MQITRNVVIRLIILALGAVLLTFAGLNWHNAVAAWVAPVFLLYYTRNATWKGILLFLLMMFFAGIFSQTYSNVLGLFIVNLVNGLSFSILYGLVYILDKLLYKKRSGFIYTLIFPAIIVSMEYLVSLSMGTWGIITHTQYPLLGFLQITSVLGPFIISFMVAWTASVCNWAYENIGNRKRTIPGSLILGSVLVIIVLFGILRLRYSGDAVQEVKVAMVPGDTDIHSLAKEELVILDQYDRKSGADLPQRIYASPQAINRMISKTENAASHNAKIIVWSEDALLVSSVQRDSLIERIKELCINNACYVLLAVLEQADDDKELPFNNVSILITPEGSIAWKYLKSYLHPIAEKPIINAGYFEMPTHKSEYGVLGGEICVDLDRTDYTFQSGKKNVAILLVPSYDWKGIDPLHSQMARVEAIRNGCAIIRPNGNGYSVIYDAFGKEVASSKMQPDDNDVLLANLPVYHINTISAKIGQVLEFACLALLLVFLLLKVFKRK
ncbi:nitrilase-related carbon-nitrogen hydrolase [Bacteroidota bacterium]